LFITVLHDYASYEAAFLASILTAIIERLYRAMQGYLGGVDLKN
jgi:glutathione synthase/RimK-type ligase-like ATP-grasp enzyme